MKWLPAYLWHNNTDKAGPFHFPHLVSFLYINNFLPCRWVYGWKCLATIRVDKLVIDK